MDTRTISFKHTDGSDIRYSLAINLKKSKVSLTSVDFNQSHYKFVEKLGEGSSCDVALFKKKNDKSTMVVKAIKLTSESDISKDDVNEIAAHQLNKELKARKIDVGFTNEIYPQHGMRSYAINHYRLSQAQGSSPYIVTDVVFVIEPYFGKKLNHFLEQKDITQKDILETWIAVTKELARIHAMGIIHGDIGPGNIVIDRDSVTSKITATYIDCELTYRTSDQRATKTRMKKAQFKNCYWPDNRLGDDPSDLKPNVKQDIFNLAWTIDWMQRRTKVQYSKALNDLCQRGLRQTESERPDLICFINQFESELRMQPLEQKAAPVAQSLDQKLMPLTRAKKENFVSELKKIIPQLTRTDILDLFAKIKVRNNKTYKFIHDQKNPTWDGFRLFFKAKCNGESNFWHTTTYQNAVKELKKAYLQKKDKIPSHRTQDRIAFLNYVRGNAPVHYKETTSTQRYNPKR